MTEDPAPGNIWVKLFVLLVLILVNAFFAMSEIAIISLKDNKVRKLAEDGDKKAKQVLKLTESPSAFLSTIQIGVTLAGFLTSASASENFSEPLAALIVKVFSLPAASVGALKAVSLVVVTIIISYFSLVLGELAPKRIAMQKSEEIAYKIVGILLFVKTAAKPFIKILSFSTNLVLRILGFDPNANEEVVTEEEIRMMVDEGEEKGVIEESQKEMINNIFEFDDSYASDIMTHRTDVTAVSIDDTIEDAIEAAARDGYSRIPVYGEDFDDIRGVFYVKDFLKYMGKEIPEDLKLADVIRSAEFVPETKKCDELLELMTSSHIQIVFVCDEYGGVAGIVTIEDLLEEIVGNIQDEYDDEEEEIVEVNETTFTLDGTTDLEEVEELLGIEFPEGEYETIGGFMMSELGRIPDEGETPEIEYGGCNFRINGVAERRITTVTAEKLLIEEETEE